MKTNKTKTQMISEMNNVYCVRYSHFELTDEGVVQCYDSFMGNDRSFYTFREFYNLYKLYAKNVQASGAKKCYTKLLNKRNRQQTKQLIHAEMYDDIPQRTTKVYGDVIDWYWN